MKDERDSIGDVAFGGSRFIFWCLAPVLLISGVGLPFLLGDWTPQKVIVTAAWTACSLLAIPALYDSKRFWWAARSVTGLIVLAYAAYVIHEFSFTDDEFGLTGPRSESSPRNAILGFFVIGLPCLWYTIFGRFQFRVDDDPEDATSEAEGD